MYIKYLIKLLIISISAKPIAAESAEAKCKDFCPEMVNLKLVNSKGISVSITEVTVEEFRRFINDTSYQQKPGCFYFDPEPGYREDGSWNKVGFVQQSDHPVACVSFNDTQEYIKWLNSKTGLSFRLPESSEWNQFARAKSDMRYQSGENWNCMAGNIADLALSMSDQFWSERSNKGCNDGYERTAPVKSFHPNAMGIHDIHGNLWEWTQTCSKTVKEICTHRIIRGGSWGNHSTGLSFDSHWEQQQSSADNGIGFRIILDHEE